MKLKFLLSSILLLTFVGTFSQTSEISYLKNEIDSLKSVVKIQQQIIDNQLEIKSFYEDKVNFILEKSIDSSLGAASNMLAVFSGYITILLFIIGFISFNRFKAYDKQLKEYIETIRKNLLNDINKIEIKQRDEFISFKKDYSLRMSELYYFEFTLQGTIAMVQALAKNPILAIRWMLSSMNLVFEKIIKNDEIFIKEIDNKQFLRLFAYLENYISQLSKLDLETWSDIKSKLDNSIFEKIDKYFNDLVTYSFTFNNEQYKNEVMSLMNLYQDIVNMLNDKEKKSVIDKEIEKIRNEETDKKKNEE